MNRFEKWIMRRAIRRIVFQSMHSFKITEIYKIVSDAAEERFTEDNGATLKSYLTECFDTAFNQSHGRA